MRVVGLDVSRTFGEIAYLEEGKVKAGGRVQLDQPGLKRFGEHELKRTDHVVLEATGNTAAIVTALTPYVARVVIANPLQVRLIAEARVKTDKIDAAVLAQLYASGFLPEVWIPDDATQALRRQAARCEQIVSQRTRLKNEIQSVLMAHLIPRCPASDLFGKRGRAWLTDQPLPLDERLGIEQRLREIDRLGEDLVVVERTLAQATEEDAQVARLLTITGVNVAVAIALRAAIGDITRFASSAKLVSYFGLNPKVRQSGLAPAQHGHISKRGRAQARAMLVEAAWAAAHAPGPLHAFFTRIRARRGQQIAAVATARKLALIVWHVLQEEQSYDWERPALTAAKRRRLELQAGHPAQHGSHKGIAAAYNVKALRDRERALAERAERAYARSVRGWAPHGPRKQVSAPS